MLALIDGDNLAFACAASAEEEDEAIAVSRTATMVEGILHDTSATGYELWLSGPNNFRYQVYPEYKAQRKDKPRPTHEKACRQYLIDSWQANLSDGCEADDMLGARQMELKPKFGEPMVKQEGLPFDQWEFGSASIICHLDKDLNQIPGWHFNWELRRKENIVREKKTYFVTPEEADRFFYYQLLIGDATDNIKGVRGIGPVKASSFLDGVPKQEWYAGIKDMFTCEEELDMNAQCVYIWRKNKDNWRNIIGETTIS